MTAQPTPRIRRPRNASTSLAGLLVLALAPLPPGALLAGGLVAAGASLSPGSAAAQTRQLVVELGASTFLPPVGLEGDFAGYVTGGLRGEWFGYGGSGVSASFLGGRSADARAGADFLSGDLAGYLRHPLSRHWSLGTEGRVEGFTVSQPYPYRAVSAEGKVDLRVQGESVSLTVAGTGGVGRSRVDLFRYSGGPVVTVEDDLWRYGGTVDLLAGSSEVAMGVSAGYHESAGGAYSSVGGRMVVAVGRGAMEVRLDRWDTPVGVETTGGVAVTIPLGSWSIRGFLGRSEPDPLILAEPGGGGGGILLGYRLAGSDGLERERGTPLYRVLRPEGAGARIRFRLKGPAADRVELLGDFTRWDPVVMTREDDGWTVDLTVAPGTHHFGFNVDGEWYLPEDAPDAVPDEWGRRNATLVVEGGS